MENRRMPPLTGLRAFEAVARHASFKRAAAELAVTPAAVSHQIKNLEEHLDATLVIRLNRAIRLTEAGRRLAEGLTMGFDQLQAAVDQVRPSAEDKILVVGSGPGLAAKWLAPRLTRFLEAHPDMEVRVAASLGMANFIIDGVDLGLRFGRVSYDGLFGEPLAAESVAPMVTPGFLADHPMSGPDDLKGLPLLHDDSLAFLNTPPDWAAWARYAGVEGLNTNRGPRFNQADHALDAALGSAGVVLGRVVLAENDVKSGRLVIPFGPVMPVGLGFHLVCAKGRELEPKVKLFRDWVKGEMG